MRMNVDAVLCFYIFCSLFGIEYFVFHHNNKMNMRYFGCISTLIADALFPEANLSNVAINNL